MNKKTALIAAAGGVVLLLVGAGIALGVANLVDDNDRLTGSTLERASSAALAEVGPGTVTSAERSDDGGPAYNLEVRLDNGDEVDVELDESYTVVWVGDLDSSDDGAYVPSATPTASPSASASAAPGTGENAAADQASAEAAALAHVGSGSVTEFDRSDDRDHLYEVEVTLPNGEDVDVELDANFTVTEVDDVVQ